MADMESSGITTTCGSSSKVLSQELSDIGSEQQNHPVEGDSIVCEQGFGEGKECPASLVPVAATEGDDDDDVLFIFSAPRSKKQQRRRYVKLPIAANHLLTIPKARIASHDACLQSTM